MYTRRTANALSRAQRDYPGHCAKIRPIFVGIVVTVAVVDRKHTHWITVRAAVDHRCHRIGPASRGTAAPSVLTMIRGV
jgi:hypothetical protein